MQLRILAQIERPFQIEPVQLDRRLNGYVTATQLRQSELMAVVARVFPGLSHDPTSHCWAEGGDHGPDSESLQRLLRRRKLLLDQLSDAVTRSPSDVVRGVLTDLYHVNGQVKAKIASLKRGEQNEGDETYTLAWNEWQDGLDSPPRI